MKREKKLTKVRNDCMKNAQKDAEELLSKIKEKIDNQVLEELEPYNIMQEIKFNREMKNIEKEYHANYYLLETELKNKIIQKQEEIRQDFRNELEHRIINFVRK